jgi:hypothetical protein
MVECLCATDPLLYLFRGGVSRSTLIIVPGEDSRCGNENRANRGVTCTKVNPGLSLEVQSRRRITKRADVIRQSTLPMLAGICPLEKRNT